MCFSKPDVKQADPEKERLAAEAEAQRKANEEALADARRRRQQAGLLSTEKPAGGSVLASAKPASKGSSSTVLSGGA